MLLRPPAKLNARVQSSKVILTNIQKRKYQKKICSADQMNITKPLSRAHQVAHDLDHYYYQFPKVPRPKRNVIYYYSPKSGFQSKRLFGTKSELSQQKQQQERQAAEDLHKKKIAKRINRIFTLTFVSFIFYGISSKLKPADDAEVKPTEDHSWKFYAYSTLPLKSISRVWGKFNSIELPVWMRSPGYKFYSSIFGVSLDEMEEQDLTKFKNLGDFFYRTLKPGVRPIADSLLVSPCDGKVLKFGVVENGEIEQVKGMTYSVDNLLGSSENLRKKMNDIQFGAHQDDGAMEHVQKDEQFAELNGISYTVDDLIGSEQGHHFNKDISFKREGDAALRRASSSREETLDQELHEVENKSRKARTSLFFAVIYLAPGDYHRFHSPAAWVPTLRRHFIGELYSVAPYFQETLKGLFILNERVSLLGYWKHGFFSMTPVGATNVGSIKINFDKQLVTNSPWEDDTKSHKVEKNTCYEASYSGASKVLGGFPLLKGEEIGGFRLGSTVVLVFEAPENFKFKLQNGQYLKMGQSIGDVESDK